MDILTENLVSQIIISVITAIAVVTIKEILDIISGRRYCNCQKTKKIEPENIEPLVEFNTEPKIR